MWDSSMIKRLKDNEEVELTEGKGAKSAFADACSERTAELSQRDEAALSRCAKEVRKEDIRS
ncbi:hypothetical protein BT69DRAFT_1284360 [Atractiella rhizophila]|nr:hypothetical protein BT69DRAFT_1284359 [Atractiella rhizophila]KAH8920012.1 hypothetical protein BT69DRAFT_1284360 [Atractiella rhizophila]